MFFALGFGALILVIMAVIFCADGRNGYATICALAALLCFFLSMYPTCKISDEPFTREDKPYVTHEIMALNDSLMMAGRIYLRGGYINENHTYLYGYKTSTGGMKSQEVDASIATVYFTDDVAPQARWYKLHRKFWWESQTAYQCDIYVPQDSLVADYTVDLK